GSPQYRCNGIGLSVMGMGTEWRASLVKDLARTADGQWSYLDASEPDSAERVLVEEFERLTSPASLDAELHLRPLADVKIQRVRMVTPEIQELPLLEPEDRHLVASLGNLENDSATCYLLDLTLPRRPEGKVGIADV